MYLNYVVVHSKCLLLELLGDVAEKVDIKVLENLDVLENPAVQEGTHFDLKVLVEHSEHFLLVELHLLFAVKHVFQVPPDLQPKFFGDFLPQQELVYVGHLLLVLLSVHVVLSDQAAD